MHLGLVTPVYPPYRGGIGAVAAQERRELRQLNNKVTVFTPDYGRDEQAEADVVRLRPWFAWGNAAVVPSLFWRLREVDVIHLHYPFYGSEIFAALAAWWWRKPLIVTFHMRPQADGWPGWLFTLFRWLVEPFVMLAARTVIVSSRDYASAEHIRHARLVELPFGVDTRRFSPGDSHVLRERYGLRQDVATLLFVGGMDEAHYFKGVEQLLHACAEIKLPWQLMLVGDGRLRGLYAALAERLGIRDQVHFLGSLSYELLPEAYRAADLHILPSINRAEAFGLVTLEAMATGVPSIVTNLPGVRTLVEDGVTGFVVKPGDSDELADRLTQLLRDPLLRKRFGQAARARALAKFDQTALAKQFSALLDLYNGKAS